MLRGVSLLIGASAVSGAFDCSFASSYPRQYVSYYTPNDIVVDGKLDDAAWLEVPFTERFVDISTATAPKYSTRAKIRWSQDWLYVGALLEEPQAFANITYTCHCNTTTADQVIFHDNDFEVFIDPAGTTHNYKEFEMNAANATWDLLLNKPYDDGGFENSSRVFGPAGWDEVPPLHSKAFVYGALNNPAVGSAAWSVEIAFPVSKLLDATPGVPPANGKFWRINFSRVEWAVAVVNGKYWKQPSCQSCPVPGTDAEDNWVWSPQGSIAMHLPEKWGVLQFSDGPVNSTAPVWYAEWPVRSVAAAVYYAQHAYAAANNGTFAATPAALVPFLEDPAIVDGTCTNGVPVSLMPYADPVTGAPRFNATVPPSQVGQADLGASVTDDRLLLTFPW